MCVCMCWCVCACLSVVCVCLCVRVCLCMCFVGLVEFCLAAVLACPRQIIVVVNNECLLACSLALFRA